MAESEITDKLQEIHARLRSVNDELEQQQKSVTDKLSEHQGQVGFLNRIHST
jgi:hypothetical protein